MRELNQLRKACHDLVIKQKGVKSDEFQQFLNAQYDQMALQQIYNDLQGFSGWHIPKIYDFQQQLKISEEQSHEPFWQAVYQKAFPNMVNCMMCSGDVDSQRLGVDRLVYLSNNRVLRIDEKKRSKVYQTEDIGLEYISVDTENKPGWIEKELVIDYLAYARMPTRICYLLDWISLKRAWKEYGTSWKKIYPCHPTQNRGYRTWSVYVPVTEIYRAIHQVMMIDVSVETRGWAFEN